MDQTTEQIRAEIAQTRARLGEDLSQLGYKVRQETDWRVHYRRHPWAFWGAALGAAVVLGFLTFSMARRVSR